MTSLNEHIDGYNYHRRAILEAFGFKEQWHDYPIWDERDSLWFVDDDEVIHADRIEDFSDDMKWYSSCIVRSKDGTMIYSKDGLSMMIIDTQTDGNIVLSIRDDLKRLTENPIKEENG